MRLAAVAIENFRCFGAQTRIEFDDLTMLVGKNDAGKSAILEALGVFFDEVTLETDDRTVGAASKEVVITCEFDDLPASLVLDTRAPTTLEAEYLLHGNGRLVVMRTYDGALAKPRLLSTVAIAEHPTAEGCSDLLQLKNSELKKRAGELSIDLDGIDPKQNPPLRAAIWQKAEDLKIREVEVPLGAANAKSIWTALSSHLPMFALFKSDRTSTDQDSEAQDPLKQAVKEAISAKQAELDALAEYVEQEVKHVAEATVTKLREMDPELASDLSPQFRPPAWANVFKVSLTDDAEIPVNKRGSGVRRLILLNFFRAKAEQTASDSNRPGVIYALEEPETSQHPDNQRILLSAFQDIASVPGNQVVLTSHTPVLARRLPESALRYVAVNDDRSRTVHGASSDDTRQLIASALGVLPDHDVRLFVGVEGKNDIEFFKRIAAALRSGGEEVPDIAAAEAEGRLVFIPLGGSNLALWVTRLKQLNRPEIYIFDRDAPPSDRAKYQDKADQINALPSSRALITGKLEIENYLHPSAIAEARPELAPLPTLGDFVDVPTAIARHTHSLSDSETPWEELPGERQKKKEATVKSWLNRQAVDRMTPERLSEIDPDDEVRGWLREIGKHLA